MIRFDVVSAKKPAQLIRCLSMPAASHVSGMPCQLGVGSTPAPQKAHREAGEPALVPAPSPAVCQGLRAHCLWAKAAGCQFLLCTLWNARLGQGGDLSNELNQNVPFSLHTPHQSLLNNNKRRFLCVSNPNPNNSRRLQNSSLTHRWEIPGLLSSSIKHTDKRETLTEFLLS